MDVYEKSLALHEQLGGKIEITVRAPLETREDLSLAYTPGVARPCKEIEADYAKSFTLTRRGNVVAVVTDGSAVLGLGDIGAAAGMPVMEGKCALFKRFGGVDAVPICVDSRDVDEIVRTVHLISKSFGGINLEDISAPRCFEIEARLKELCDVPVFHDDQHGTAIVVAAAMLNAAKVTGRKPEEMRVVVNGAGSAGIAVSKLLRDIGFGELTVCDIGGILDPAGDINPAQRALALTVNRSGLRGSLADAVKGADAFVGVSAGRVLSGEMVATMAKGPVVFAMANPVPEITPEEALAAGAAVVGTGRSDYPNQINNLLAFPGIFKGALKCRAKAITEPMKHAAARALAALVPESELSPTNIIPDVFAPGVADAVAAAVIEANAREASS
ncbi:MAG: NADP-dependent malic enzyme [Clostridia bacterium]|nr:NADP-dependent malic enzyme [Clostridia bacterium]